MLNHWYVVASQDTLKILIQDEDHPDLQILHKLEEPIAKESRNRFNPPKRGDTHQTAALDFARTISAFLQLELQKKSFHTLTVAAEPRFLGKLRRELTPQVLKTVTQWVRKDLQKTPVHNLPKLLLEATAIPAQVEGSLLT